MQAHLSSSELHHPSPSELDAILARYPREQSSLVMILQDVQRAFSFLPCEALDQVAKRLGLSRSQVYSVATFYKAFSLTPQGRTVVQICKGTACHVRGAQLLEDELARELSVPVGSTTEDGAVTLRTVNCVGACAMAPVVMVGEEHLGEVSPGDVRRIARRARRPAEESEAPKVHEAATELTCLRSVHELGRQLARYRQVHGALAGEIRVCGGPGCLAAGSRAVHQALHAAAEKLELPLRVAFSDCLHQRDDDAPELLSLTGCQGLCQQGPLVQLLPEDLLYTQVHPSDAEALLKARAANVVEERLLGDVPGRADHPFFRSQTLVALDDCRRIDPSSWEHYAAIGGFAALAHVLQRLSPEQVLDEVAESGLRGRGGAGFLAARKWRTALAAAKERGLAPYVICNGDEGDPGAFMDRAIMEGSPYQVIEGMLLGAYALGAERGYLYVRNEYPLAVQRLEQAIGCCKALGLLGKQILGTSFSFELSISRGGGAFVCGESTALMRSIEGKVGEPRAKYVRSAERGLYDAPTVLNNVETWALVPRILREGGARFAQLGTERSKGTKAFSLTGQVRRTGLVEVEMGTSLRQLIFEIGGGPLPGRTFKAVQTGGPSGGCLPASKLDLPVDFEALSEAGSMMGSGGMIVMDDHTCMVDVARYFVRFLGEESCGKCSPCRLGLFQLEGLLQKVVCGEAEQADLSLIAELGQTMIDNSLCGLGKSAANPVLSTLRYFAEEYEAHLAGRCPAGVCDALLDFRITEDCIGCLACLRACPADAIRGERREIHVVDSEKCTGCGVCRAVCSYEAVEVLSGGEVVVAAKSLPTGGAA